MIADFDDDAACGSFFNYRFVFSLPDRLKCVIAESATDLWLGRFIISVRPSNYFFINIIISRNDSELNAISLS